MKRERTIRIAILGVVFVLAIIGFSIWTNRGSADLTADMGAATLPTISFQSEGKEVNLLVGHQKEMDMVAMRDTIAVYDKEKLTVYIQAYENEIKELAYEVYSLDGTEILKEGTIDKVGEKVSLEMGKKLPQDQEGILKITLKTEKDQFYYYTRVLKDQDYHVKECLEYVMELHGNMLKKENEDDVKKVMESSSKGNNTTLQQVTINSNIKHSMWGNLKPKIVNGPYVEIKEAKSAYTSVLLRYQVECAGDNNEKETYLVKEFFKVAYGTKRVYLLDYERTMEEIFDTANVVLSSKGIILGIAEEGLSYKVNQEGTIVSFVQANELWAYNKNEDEMSLVFSFADSEKEDVRNYTDKHSIQILSMEDSGDMTFSVCGYMNRGVHEGESGVALYYYNMEHNSIEEEAFIPSNSSHQIIEKELNELAYYNKEQGMLYVMVDGTLLSVQPDKDKQTVLMEGMEKGQYVASEDGHLLAYQKEDGEQSVTEVRDFAKNKTWTVEAESGEFVIPLGFVGDDFVYGISKADNAGVDVAGANVQAMHRLEIRGENNQVVKTYEKKDVYILGVTIDSNMITLKQGTKEGNRYTEIAEDYITNNASSGNEYVSLQSYWTDLKETQYRITFSKGIKDKNAKVLKPKQVIQETPTVLELDNQMEAYYYVYGHGEQAGVFSDAGDAVVLAEKLSGVVISPKQNYVWEADNRVSWYRNFEVDRFTPQNGETTLSACVRKVLSYEGKKADAVSEIGTKPVQDILSEQLKTEAVRFSGCSVKEMCYLMDKGVPVIAMKDGNSAILLIGYDAKTITYVEPSSGSIFSSNIEKVDEMLSGSGRTFIGYIK